MCYRKAESSVIAWTDENLLVLGQAVRGDLGDLSLYEWWLSAGPADAETPPEKDGGAAAVDFPQGTFLAEVTDEQDLRELGVSGLLSATAGIRLDDGVYRDTYGGPAYQYRDGTYVLTKGPTVVFTETTTTVGTTVGCSGNSATYRWTEKPDGSVRWTFLEGDSPCRPGPFPTTSEPWVPGPVGEIAFGQYGEIVVESVDQLTAQRLTNTPLLANAQPVWSPDGARILFSSNRPDPDSTVHLYVMDPDGSNVQQITDAPGNEWDPAWSPDGSRIAFHAESTGIRDEPFPSSLTLIDPDGSDRVDLITREDHYVGCPSWSPDGTRIALCIDTSIYLVNADGTGLRKLAANPGVDLTYTTWTPDGDRIVFWGDDGEGAETILTIRPDGSGLQALSRELPDADILIPSWSPDGQWIALAGDFLAAAPLYLFRADGGPFYTFGLNASAPSWRPAP